MGILTWGRLAPLAWLVAVICLGSSARAQTPDTPPPGACNPTCRTGFVCLAGNCVEACNPPCGAGMQCSITAECEPIPGMAQPAPAPAPTPAPAPPPAPTPAPAPQQQPQWGAPSGGTTEPPSYSDAIAGPSVAEQPGVRFHDGFYFRFGIGAGPIGAEVIPEGADDGLHVGGIAIATELAFGGTPAPGIVLGGGIYNLSIPSAKYTVGRGDFVREEDAEFGVLTMVGPFLDAYVSPKHGVHFQVAPCFSSVAPGQSDTIVTQDVTGSGFGVMAGVGVEGWVGEQLGVGLLARVQYAKYTVKDEDDDEYDFEMFAPTLLLTTTLH